MDQLEKDHERLERSGNLAKGIEDVQRMIDELKAARAHIVAEPQSTPQTLGKLQVSVKKGFDRVNDDLKDIYKGLNQYSKSLEKKFKDVSLTFAENDTLSSHPALINRAIAMHLLREGHFQVATTFIAEANAHPPPAPSLTRHASPIDPSLVPTQKHLEQMQASQQAWEQDFAPPAYKSAMLQQQFSEMYYILHELRNRRNLWPAIAWAERNRSMLKARGSHLEFDLCRLQYVSLFASTAPDEGPLAAIHYARRTFPSFGPRYTSQTNSLLGALAFTPNIAASPYAPLFSTSSDSNTTASVAATAFTAEFCALLSLSSASPLLTAVTAGCIALPTLLKLSQIQAAHHTSWTTASELPVEIPLPPQYQFHSVFVCPVSKEQTTDANPPMMMPCGHVLARESLERVSKGTRFKCPYCPAESQMRDAKMVFL